MHHYLNTHPSIFMCEPKEPCYFVHPAQLDWPKIKELKLWEKEERYLELFKPAGDAAIIGESSTLYAKAPKISDIPERVAQFNRDARFIYIMRDPIERTISHYWHEMRQGNESQDMLTAIRQNKDYCDVSNYARQLEPYFNQFGREKVLTLTFEEMVADTSTIVRQVFEWLGVDSSFEPSNLEEKVHVTPQRFYQKGRIFRLRYTWPWSAIISLLPKKIRSFGLQAAVKEIDRSSAPKHPKEVLDFLQPMQQEQTRELSQMLGRESPEWKTLSSMLLGYKPVLWVIYTCLSSLSHAWIEHRMKQFKGV